MRFSFSLYSLLFAFLVLVHCSKDPDEVIADLKEDITNLSVNNEDRQEEGEKLLSKIQELEDNENDKRIQILSKNTNNAIIAISADGSTLVASIHKDWIVLSQNGLHSNSVHSIATKINTSYHGQYVLYATNHNNQCLYSVIDLGIDGSKFDIQENVLEIDCNNSVIINNKGQLFYARSGDVFRYSPSNKKEILVLGKSLFKSNYPKIANTLHLISIPDGLWLLYGAAGYYDLYHYSGTPNSARKVYPGVASPTVQFTANNLFSLEDEPESTPINKNQPTLFLYSGEAGRYSLQGFHLPATPWKSFRVPVRKTVYYLSNSDQFLYIKDKYPIRYNVNNGKETKLPLRASQIFVHQSGLVYVNSKNQLVLRKEPYSDFEKKLFQLKEELEQNLR